LGKITIPFFLSLFFLISTLVKKYRLIQFSVILMLIYSLLNLNVIGIIIGITILVFIERESFKNHILNKEVKIINEATQEE
jgi:hypothetical protein